ncbi:MAG: NAD(P)H-dependent oxidoreductase subunit E [Bacteroidetes bacterium]|jgi:NADH-quinone oxidoreductase subunit E|nr:NAD(P)H-dependent oxidoreductase subunit E [Bacteroidota bacterium]
MEEFALTKIVNHHGTEREKLMPILQEIVEKQHYLSDDDMVKVANALQLSAAEVYGTASFYSFLPTQKRGIYVIRICKSIIARMKGSQEVLQAISDQLNLKPGETTADELFSLEEVNDIGWSDHEPAMLINDKVYTDLTPEKATRIISKYLEQASQSKLSFNPTQN